MAKRKQQLRDTGRVIGYIRVSTQRQAEGDSPEAQRDAIERACAAYGWQLVDVVTDNGNSGKIEPDKRKGLAPALVRLDAAEADILLATKIDRVCRSARDLLNLFHRGKLNGWRPILLNFMIDTSTPIGRFCLTQVAAAAEFEADMISERTSEVLAYKRDVQGITLGRPVQISDDTGGKISALRSEGLTWQQVAEQMNSLGIQTARGGPWRASTCRDVHARLTR